MRGSGGDDADPEPGRQVGQCGVAFVVEWMPVMGELDADPVAAEPVHQIGKRLFRGLWATVGKRLADMALRQPVRMCQCPAAASVSAS